MANRKCQYYIFVNGEYQWLWLQNMFVLHLYHFEITIIDLNMLKQTSYCGHSEGSETNSFVGMCVCVGGGGGGGGGTPLAHGLYEIWCGYDFKIECQTCV